MQATSGRTRSVWMDSAEVLQYAPLAANTTADVCIVGGGLAGLTTAYLLANEGARVVLLEQQGIGSGETGRTTAHLSSALDRLYSEVESDIGTDGIRLAAHSHATAIDVIERIVERENINCDFERVDGYMFAPPGESVDTLHRELDAIQRAGLGGVRMVGRSPLPDFDTGPSLCFERQGQFHPLKYLNGLARGITRRGGRICTRTHVTGVSGGAQPHVATSSDLVVQAASVVVATNSPLHENLQIHLKQSPYRTYVIGAEIVPGSVPKALYWDTANPFHYVRLCSVSAGRDILIVGGEDHRAGAADDGDRRFEALEHWTRKRFRIRGVEYRWSGQVMEAADGVGLLGRDLLDQPNVYLATGDSGQGMTHGTIAGMLLTDRLGGRDNAWRQLYDPTRFPTYSADFYEDAVKVLQHYADWFTGGDVGSTDAIHRCDGAVIRSGAVKLAAFRDEHGRLSEFSAVCPHMGCIVTWNSTEQLWNCPCHGSRFDARGAVLNGPAAAPLTPVRRRP